MPVAKKYTQGFIDNIIGMRKENRSFQYIGNTLGMTRHAVWGLLDRRTVKRVKTKREDEAWDAHRYDDVHINNISLECEFTVWDT